MTSLKSGAVLARVAAPVVRAVVRGQLAMDQLARVLHPVVLGALSDAELADLSLALVDAGGAYRGLDVPAWEDAWWHAELPAAPARVLVLACGAGREPLALVARGYTVEACEPGDAMFRLLQARTAHVEPAVLQVRQEDFAGFVARSTTAAHVDAVLVGWGGLSHCLTDDALRALLGGARAVCPHGPVLMSWQRAPQRDDVPRDRSTVLGVAIGDKLRAWRALGSRSPGLMLAGAAGVVRGFSVEELRRCARARGERAQLVDDGVGYPHGTLRPPDAGDMVTHDDIDVIDVSDVGAVSKVGDA